MVKEDSSTEMELHDEFVENCLVISTNKCMFPLCVDDQWLMARISFKDRSIYVYDSMGDAAFRANIRSYFDAYRFIISLFLLILNFFGKRTDIQLNNGPDRGIYVALFAERFICGSNVFDNKFDVNTHRIKFGSLLWNYGKMKLEKPISSESKSWGIMKKIDHFTMVVLILVATYNVAT
ncbi:hypothetical protein H5410_060359 [Solanum commersonii]|uniref:Uncharacterized protein n=1 Tax=Solanum commersonii TaxID=4109 RepID=A0A9J5W583_SOLCO|nr:hypothetical protein H5410_060359 [Solanum commersonii]